MNGEKEFNQARLRGLARMAELRKAAEPCLETGQVCALLGVTRETIRKKVDRGQLLALPKGEDRVFPAFQPASPLLWRASISDPGEPMHKFAKTSGSITRREFARRSVALAAGAALLPCLKLQASPADSAAEDWVALREDPVRQRFAGRPDLDTILKLFPRLTGQPAFDPQRIAGKARQLQTSPPVNTGHPFLDWSVKVGLAHIDATFVGDHPKYGVGTYAKEEHDGFPPTIIAAVDALSAWGLNTRAAQLFRYWLVHFVREDGTIKYYGPSISEYGQLLHTGALLAERAGPAGWWDEGFAPLNRIAELLLHLRAEAAKTDGLIAGVPEADTREDVRKYFHNNAWVVKGLRRWVELCARQKARPSTKPGVARRAAAALEGDTLRAIEKTWPKNPSDWWLAPHVEPAPRPARLTGGAADLASYTNYRVLARAAVQRAAARQTGPPGDPRPAHRRRAVLRDDPVRRPPR